MDFQEMVNDNNNSKQQFTAPFVDKIWPANCGVLTKEEEHDEVSSFPSFQFPPLDFSDHSGVFPLNWEFGFPLFQETHPAFADEPLYSSLDLEPALNLQIPQVGVDYMFGFDGFNFHHNPNQIGNEYCGGVVVGYGNENHHHHHHNLEQWLVEEAENNHHHHQEVVMFNNIISGQEEEERKGMMMMMLKRLPPPPPPPPCREERHNNNRVSKMLSREVISKYFYMPITKAAKELNIGLTLLKKRCRELGIKRWPHRKLMSLQTLIKNVQEMSKEEDGIGGEQKVREAMEMLEREKQVMEEVPDMELMEKTKRLRQACFKANYKKRRLMGMMMVKNLPPTNNNNHQPQLLLPEIKKMSSTITSDNGRPAGEEEEEEEGKVGDEEIQSLLLSDCFSSSNSMASSFHL